MGAKYIISAFNYPFEAYERLKQAKTKWLVVALAYLICYSIKYDGVDFQKRR